MSSSADRLMLTGVLVVAVFAALLVAALLPPPASGLTHGAAAAQGFDAGPSVTIVRINSTPASGGNYVTGENIDVYVTFSGNVRVTGTPQLALTIGTNTRQAAINGGHNGAIGRTLAFRYTVVAADFDGDGISVAAGALGLNGGSISTVEGQDARLGLGTHAITNAAGHTVNDSAPSFSTTIPNKTWTHNVAISGFTLPSASGGNGTLTYALSPTLPAGVSKNASHEVTGTPTSILDNAADYTWTATDADGDTAQLTFTIAVFADTAPTFSRTVPDQVWTQNRAITRLFLPKASGGNGIRSYTLSPELPAGTSKGSVDHDVTGTPTTLQSAITYTWKATDADGDEAELTFTITVVADTAPTFSGVIPNKSWVQDSAITGFTLPSATGGNGTLTYTFSPALPAGVATTTGATFTVSGTPTGHQAAATYIWKATDADGDSAQLTFTITIAQDLMPSFSTTIANQTGTQNTAMTAFTLPTATGGNGSLTYTISPALPAGLSKDSSHQVSGTPTGYQAATTYTWTVTDADGQTAELTFTITIAQDLMPSFATTIANQTGTQDTAITAFTLPTATGGDGTLTYALSPALPAGVATTTGAAFTVSGTPTGHQTATTYTWTATDADGDTAQLTFTITIAQDLMPSFATTIANQTGTQDSVITAFTLPTASGGNAPLVYALSPDLPAGLSKSDSHSVSGTPTGYQAAATYTWTVTDADGDTAQLTFSITIAQDLMPSFSDTIPNKSWTQSSAIDGFTLPLATGGNAPLSYALSPDLPAGVSKSDSHAVSGTSVGYQAEATYTWTATDADGDTAELTFTITVAEDLVPSFPTTVADQNWRQRRAIDGFTLPLATGGNAPLVYALSPALPAGVSQNAGHAVSGAPTRVQRPTAYTWRVTDADGDTAQLTFTIAVTQRRILTPPVPEDLVPSFSTTIADQTWTQRRAISGFTLPRASGGDGPLTYRLSPGLPAGASKSDSHRITGTPSGHQAARTYTWKATDVDGDSAQLTFTITIAEDLSPSFATTIANQLWTQRDAIAGFTLPPASGGDGTLTYRLSPSLPAGVSKSASHRVSGAPTGYQAAATYTWRATDADGDTAELTFTIMVLPATPAPPPTPTPAPPAPTPTPTPPAPTPTPTPPERSEPSAPAPTPAPTATPEPPPPTPTPEPPAPVFVPEPPIPENPVAFGASGEDARAQVSAPALVPTPTPAPIPTPVWPTPIPTSRLQLTGTAGTPIPKPTPDGALAMAFPSEPPAPPSEGPPAGSDEPGAGEITAGPTAPPSEPSSLTNGGVSPVWWLLLLLLALVAIMFLVAKNRRRLGLARTPAAYYEQDLTRRKKGMG